MLRYHYTDGTTAASVSGSGPFANTPWDTARTGVIARTRPTTRAGIWTELQFALNQAGWTEQVVGTRDSTWRSTGESGLENICIRIRHGTQFLNFEVAPKMDASNLLQGGIGVATTATHERWDLTAADFVSDFQILCCRDWLWAVFQNTAHTGVMYAAFVGNLQRTGTGLNTNVLLSSAPIVAGQFVSIPCTSNPILLGYRHGDLIGIVEVATAQTAKAERQLVVDLTSNSFIVRRLAQNYAAGARIGALPSPVARWVSGNITMGSAGLNFTTPYQHDGIIDNDLILTIDPSGEQLYDSEYALNPDHAQVGTEFGSGTTGNNRTLRLTSRSILLRKFQSAVTTSIPGSAVGIVPSLYAYPGTSAFYPHDNMQFNRVTPVQDFVPLRLTATSVEHYILGPTPGP